VNKKAIFYVYCLRRQDEADPFHLELDQPFWFGKGSNGRMHSHRKAAKKCLRDSSLPRDTRINIIIKLWSLGFDFTEEAIIKNLTEEESFYYEKEFIKIYGRKNNGTGCLANLTDGGEGTSGYIYSEESKQKMRGPKTEEHKKQLRLAKIGKPSNRKGIPISEEQKKLLSLLNSGENHPQYRKPKSEKN
jgi:hypothetical protein